MPEEKNTQPGSDDGAAAAASQAGNPDKLIQPGPQANDGQPGEGGTPSASDDGAKQDFNPADFVPKGQYEELSTKIGEQGQELGDFRNFFQEVSPLLEKLQARPDLVEAIMEDKITSETATAIADGKFSLGDATEVKQAQEAVKKDLGVKKFAKTDPKDVEALIDKKLSEHTKEVEEKVKKASDDVSQTLTKAEEKQNFMKNVEAFIANTPDFQEHAEAINKYFQDNPDQYDVETVYYAVKGRSEAARVAKEAEKAGVVGAKGLAANAAGGGSQGGDVINDEGVIDSLVSPKGNPNIL